MREFKDKVAVVTGAASGIGLGLAHHCVLEGMKVVLADIDESELERAEEKLKAAGGNVLAVRTDVTDPEDVEILARKSKEQFGAAHLLFNNAGVEVRGAVWEQTLADWKWIIDVNLWGVIHGIRTFVPIMMKQDTECHIVNTGSGGALISGPTVGSYRTTKSAVITLSEVLYHELELHNTQIRVSILLPGFVRSRLIYSEQRRPEAYRNPEGERQLPAYEHDMIKMFQELNRDGMDPQRFAGLVFDGIKENRFYINPHPEFDAAIQTRLDDIAQKRNPTRISEIPKSS
jgi:NAD(P)-dependent dehydrogenase (short-subunit alcohol dehydrogenase family)